ncbi:MAG: hypothetical protein KJ069_04170 [Anaerolineae bacterium]|nr:hypothetical protein [Anaerolineae bacterium]
MKSFSLALILLLWTACATPPAAETPTPTPAPASTELIEFESLTFPGHLWTPFMPPVAEGTAVTVTGALSIPASNRPVPAIVLTHGCGSITAGELAWAERLNEMGVAAE